MPKRNLQGVVVSDKQDKTVVVRVERRYTHPVMKKTVRRTKKYYAHDEKNEYSVGDIVWIEEHKPISKLKHWIVTEGQKMAKSEAPIGGAEKRVSVKRGKPEAKAEAPAAAPAKAKKTDKTEKPAKPARAKRATKPKES